MRAIKFRAQDIASNKWLYGDIRHHKNDVCIFEQGGNRGEQVKPDTVGQFTGILDEDQHDIYEGDIIKIVEEFDDENVYTRIGVVCFEEGMYELQDKNGKHFAYLGWLMHDDAITKLEVIGNIHDNPEMLEKGGQNK